MSYDVIIRGGTVVDGTGAPARTADVAVRDGLIVDVGRVDGTRERTIDADGLTVTPGFVDIHTHFDGQATWDPHLTPSCWHGVTTAILGNCGIGFAPVHADRHDWLIDLMEGVEDIPGSALAEGITWEWETFGEYLDALERMPRAVDVGTQIPHAALRGYVMGDRALEARPPPTTSRRCSAPSSTGCAQARWACRSAVPPGTAVPQANTCRAPSPRRTNSAR